ncbi:hypothetical protein LJC01_02210 [Clostridiaceae bacterium OttesenSCG-928-D20]|nr:hypothetical protein [Clostridiaceae bacterium OttesenSCG-928-D20]
MEKLPKLSARDRLRYLVCREFSALPIEAEISDIDVIKCALNILADRGKGRAGVINNPSFDEDRFESLKGELDE